MAKLNINDLERLEELKRIIWGHAATRSICSEDNPFLIAEETICDHKGRAAKAIRLLTDAGYISWAGRKTIKRIWGDTTIKTYNIHKMEESRAVEVEPVFITDIQNTHDEIFNNVFDTQFEFDTVIYKNAGALGNKYAIYVYWHQEDYEIITHKDSITWEVRLYPKSLKDLRFKNIMRSLVEQYFHSNFHTKVEEYLNVPEGSIKKDDHFELKIRNFAAHGHRFSMEKYFGKNGFKNEYTHFKEYFTALINRLDTFQGIINEAGGQEVVTEKYRKEIISNLLTSAHLYSFQQKKEKNRYYRYFNAVLDIERQFKNPFINVFMLKHVNYLNYEVLFNEDKEILYINEDNVCKGYDRNINAISDQDTKFTPNKDELDFIAGTD